MRQRQEIQTLSQEILQTMKIAYIAHPVAGDVSGNIEKILKIVRDINLTMPDVVPFVPYMADLLAMNDDKIPDKMYALFSYIPPHISPPSLIYNIFN